MASGITNYGKQWILEIAFEKTQNTATPADRMFVALVTDDNVPNADDENWSDLSATQIPNANGYVDGGIAIARATNFDALSHDDSGDKALVQLTNVEWTASSGPIPGSGEGAAYAILMDCAHSQAGDEAASRDGANNKIIAWWDLGGQQTVADGQKLSLQDMEIRLT